MQRFDILSCLPQALLPWYRNNKRQLPWRTDRDVYHIWLSEIMLQQTRVETVKGYYLRFLEKIPDVASLACADDALLQKLWEGLGYYSRVRNLKNAAKQIMEEHGGVFPRTHEQILALPGIGSYTAGAICSIAFDMPTPAVDGNVLRVVARLTNDPSPVNAPAFKKAVECDLKQIYPEAAGDFTQALMELGATVCGPNRAPDCESCPCRRFCLGHLSGTAQALPVKMRKAPRRQEELTLFILRCEGRYGLCRRPDAGLLAGLWQFPNIPGTLTQKQALAAVEDMELRTKQIFRMVDKKHVFTHVQWQMRGIYLEVAEPAGGLTWLTAEQIEKEAALPTAFRQFWNAADSSPQL